MRSTLCTLAFVALTAACGGAKPTTLTIDATPATVNVGSTAALTVISVTGTFNGDPLLDGSTITLETDVGSFTDDADNPQQVTELETAGHKATVKLYAPKHVNGSVVATVTAKYIDPYSAIVTATTKVTFKTATKPVKINFSCTSRNIGAFWEGVGDFGVKCTAVAEDENNERVPGARLKFLTEAGEFVPTDDPETFIYDPHVGGRTPRDVPPLAGEPSYVDEIAPHPTRNPRDGLVTLVAYVEGDSNSIYSTPYVDANDNEKYDAGEDMPPGITEFQDTQDTYIWKRIRILWSGIACCERNSPPDGTHFFSSSGAPLNVNPLKRGESRTYTLAVLDKNLNIMPANAESDSIVFSSDAGDLGLGEGQEVSTSLTHSPGIDIDNDYKIRNPSSRDTYTRDSTYTFTLTNARPADDTGDVTAHVTWRIATSLGTDESGVATGDASLTGWGFSVQLL